MTEVAQVKFKQDCPAFVGIDLEVYGPFKEGDKAEVPKANAVVLFKQGVIGKWKTKRIILRQTSLSEW